MRAEDVAPLLWRAQLECEAAAAQVICEWSVANFEAVESLLNLWLCAEVPSALPPPARQLGEAALRELLEALRAAWRRERHGL